MSTATTTEKKVEEQTAPPVVVVDTRPEWEVVLHGNPRKRVHGNTRDEAVAAYKKLMGIISSEHTFQISLLTANGLQSMETTVGDQIEDITPKAAEAGAEKPTVVEEKPAENALLNPPASRPRK